MFFKCINLCHECVTIESKVSGQTEYSGPSTDEVCFLDMARTVNSFGHLKERDSDYAYI